jgi:hypothetical protein
VQGVGEVLALLPPPARVERRVPEEVRSLLAFVTWFRRLTWDRYLLGACAAFHLIVGLLLAFAPYDQIYTAGTRPALELAPRHAWAVLFLAVGVAVATQTRTRRPGMRLFVWFAVLFLGGAWLTAFGSAVLTGSGSALGLGLWGFLYGLWATVAFRLGLGKR